MYVQEVLIWVERNGLLEGDNPISQLGSEGTGALLKDCLLGLEHIPEVPGP